MFEIIFGMKYCLWDHILKVVSKSMFKFTVLISDLRKSSKYCNFTFAFYTSEVLELFTNLFIWYSGIRE